MYVFFMRTVGDRAAGEVEAARFGLPVEYIGTDELAPGYESSVWHVQPEYNGLVSEMFHARDGQHYPGAVIATHPFNV